MIRLDNVRKRFGDHEVLKGVALEARDGETLVVLGKSGGGKSVMLRIIIGLLRPDSGSVTVDDRDVLRMSYPELQEMRAHIGFLFQGAALFDSMTVGENVALPLRRSRRLPEEDIHEQVLRNLGFVGLESSVDLMPASLSGGMRKRVGLARALAPSPRYVLYDEPTTGLDLESADRINHLINELRDTHGMTSIVVTHDLRTAFTVGNRFVILDEGRVLMTGTQEEIQNSTNENVQKYIAGTNGTSSGGSHP